VGGGLSLDMVAEFLEPTQQTLLQDLSLLIGEIGIDAFAIGRTESLCGALPLLAEQTTVSVLRHRVVGVDAL
jgi:hypothetical protein